jgi:hypothetical protein
MGTPGFMICPTAVQPKLSHTSPHTELENLAKGNYAACMGSGTYLEGIDGSAETDAMLGQTGRVDRSDRSGSHAGNRGLITVRVKQVPPKASRTEHVYVTRGVWRLGRGYGVKARRIHDGTSRTMMLSEVLAVDGKGRIAGASDDIRGVWVTASMGGSNYSHKTTPNSTVKDRINGCELDANDLPRRSRLSCVEQSATGPTAGDTFADARSEHRGGVLAASADGAVHFYGNDIDPDVWSALGTRANGD